MTVNGKLSDNSKRADGGLVSKYPVSILLFVCSIALFAYSCADWFDTDGLFIIATGRKMWETGILHTHPFSVIDGMHTVIQQWLWCLGVSALYDSIGGFGPYLLLFALQLVLACLFYAYLTDGIKGGTINRIFIFSVCLIIALMNPYNSIRPELITVDLLMAQCLCMKKYISTERLSWLYPLPLFMLAEINIHASYWIMHFVLLMPYIVPSLLPKYIPRDGVSLRLFKKHGFGLLAILLLSIGALFLNPYGIEGIGYVILSFKAGISSLSIKELSNTEYFSLCGAGCFLLCILFMISMYKKKLSGVTFYMTGGLLLLLAFVYKWFLFFPLVLFFQLYGFREELFALPVEKLKMHRVEKPVVILFAAVFLVLTVRSIVTCDQITDEDEAAVLSWLKENDVPADTHIYTGFNTGARLEFEGYESIYMDARPELYSKVFNRCRDQLDEYRICMSGRHLDDEMEPDVLAYIEDTLSDYDFEYFVVSPNKEVLLYALLTGSDDYSCLVEGEDWCLYKRSDAGGESRGR